IGGEWRSADDNSFNATNLQPGQVRLTSRARTLKYVSRGGLKLESALQHLKINPSGWRCLDIGLSTGGFADCLLQAGAAQILGVDVGHGQLHPNLQQDPRLTSLEKVNAKDLAANAQVLAWLAQGVD